MQRMVDVECIPAASGGCCLAVALGGGSDCIGALALARALGYEDIVLVMPSGGKSRGSQVVCEPVSAAEAPALPPGGDFYSNDTMLAYLLSLPIGLRPTIAKFLVQPKDAAGAKSFSLASLTATTDALFALARTHQCTAVAGLDFGGDVVLPEPLLDDYKRRLEQQPQPLSQPNMEQSASKADSAITASDDAADRAAVPSAAERVGATAGRGVKRAAEDEPEGGAPSARAREGDPVSTEPLIKQRDTLNLHALAAVARKLGVPATLVASAPGVDAAAVAPEYARRLGGPGGATVRVFAMGADEANPCSLAPVPGPAPPCSLPELPEALTRARMPATVEAAFVHELRRLAERIAYDARAQLQLQREHAYKTYSLVAACAAKLEASGALPGAVVKDDAPSSASDGGDFFVLGAYRPSEKARAHMHASVVLGLFDVAGWVWEWGEPPKS